MNKKIYLLPLRLLALIFVSCEETKEATKFDNWRARNEGYIDSLKTVFDEKTDPELKAFEPEINPKLRIYYKKKISNDTGAIPLYTDSVNVFYREVLFLAKHLTRTLRELIRGLLIHLLNLLSKHLLRLVVSPVGLRYCNVCVSEKDGLFIFRGSWLTEQVELTIFQAIQR